MQRDYTALVEPQHAEQQGHGQEGEENSRSHTISSGYYGLSTSDWDRSNNNNNTNMDDDEGPPILQQQHDHGRSLPALRPEQKT
jgi:hypothetical protein